jgi:hypothetical protein
MHGKYAICPAPTQQVFVDSNKKIVQVVDAGDKV